MVCKTTFVDRRAPIRPRFTSLANPRLRGFTMVEVLIAMTLAIVIAGVLIAFSWYSGRSILAMSNYLELDAQSRTALDTMVWQIRRSAAVTGFTTNSISLRDYDGKALTFTYDATKKELSRIKDEKKTSDTTLLLRGCDSLSFNMFARDPIDGSWALHPTTDTNECKAIFITWNCSRKYIDKKLNTESMTSATVVLRNR